MKTDVFPRVLIPSDLEPPIVKRKEDGVSAFHKYDWYFTWIRRHLKDVERVFLTPGAVTKPINSSPLHRAIYQRYAVRFGGSAAILVVSEPAVLIRYKDLSDLEPLFLYEFPPRLLGAETRTLFVKRLQIILRGKHVEGCLPRHHAALVSDAVGNRWKNYWDGDLYSMMRKAKKLSDTF